MINYADTSDARRAIQRRIAESYGAAAALVADLTGRTGLGRLAAFEDLQAHFAETSEWGELLKPHGWLKTGRTEWQHSASGLHGYTEEDRLILREKPAPERHAQITTLVELANAGVVLSPWRLQVELDYDGDDCALVRELLAESQSEPAESHA